MTTAGDGEPDLLIGHRRTIHRPRGRGPVTSGGGLTSKVGR
jgi:hypothetical protein